MTGMPGRRSATRSATSSLTTSSGRCRIAALEHCGDAHVNAAHLGDERRDGLGSGGPAATAPRRAGAPAQRLQTTPALEASVTELRATPSHTYVPPSDAV